MSPAKSPWTSNEGITKTRQAKALRESRPQPDFDPHQQRLQNPPWPVMRWIYLSHSRSTISDWPSPLPYSRLGMRM